MSDKSNISDQDEDLTGMAPQLSKLKNDSPLKVNDAYFEKFTDKLQNRIDDFEETHVDAPVLSNMPKYKEFEVPVDYFEEFPTRIQQVINNNKPSASILEWLILLIKPRVVVPVLSVVFMAVIGINFMNKNAELPKMGIAEEISVEDQLYNIDESTIIESFGTETASENENALTEDNSIENYLIENGVEEANITTKEKEL